MANAPVLPVLLLPGIDGTGEMLRPVADLIRRERPAEIFSFPADRITGYCELLELVRARAPDGRYIVVAESYSGPLGIALAATEPRVAGLVMASSFARHPLPSFLAPLGRVADLKRTPRQILFAFLLGSTGSADLRGEILALRLRLNRQVLRARVVEVLRVDKRALLGTLTCPVAVLHGRYDRLVWGRLAREVAAAVPGARLTWLPAGHMMLETHPEEAAREILRFAAGIERAGSPNDVETPGPKAEIT